MTYEELEMRVKELEKLNNHLKNENIKLKSNQNTMDDTDKTIASAIDEISNILYSENIEGFTVCLFFFL